MNRCVYVERSKNGSLKTIQGQCDHNESEHMYGTCWHIVKPDLEDVDDTDKYCKCVCNVGNIKPFILIGYTQSSSEDWMVPRECELCKKVLLLRKDNDKCSSCKVNANFK